MKIPALVRCRLLTSLVQRVVFERISYYLCVYLRILCINVFPKAKPVSLSYCNAWRRGKKWDRRVGKLNDKAYNIMCIPFECPCVLCLRHNAWNDLQNLVLQAGTIEHSGVAFASTISFLYIKSLMYSKRQLIIISTCKLNRFRTFDDTLLVQGF